MRFLMKTGSMIRRAKSWVLSVRARRSRSISFGRACTGVVEWSTLSFGGPGGAGTPADIGMRLQGKKYLVYGQSSRVTQPIFMHVHGWEMELGDRGNKCGSMKNDAERWPDSWAEGGRGVVPCSFSFPPQCTIHHVVVHHHREVHQPPRYTYLGFVSRHVG